MDRRLRHQRTSSHTIDVEESLALNNYDGFGVDEDDEVQLGSGHYRQLSNGVGRTSVQVGGCGRMCVGACVGG